MNPFNMQGCSIRGADTSITFKKCHPHNVAGSPHTWTDGTPRNPHCTKTQPAICINYQNGREKQWRFLLLAVTPVCRSAEARTRSVLI